MHNVGSRSMRKLLRVMWPHAPRTASLAILAAGQGSSNFGRSVAEESSLALAIASMELSSRDSVRWASCKTLAKPHARLFWLHSLLRAFYRITRHASVAFINSIAAAEVNLRV